MKVLTLGVSLMLWHACAQAQQSVTLYTAFDRPAPEAVISALREELDAVLQPAGFRFDWQEIKSATGHDVVRELVVVNFKGACEAPDPPEMRDEYGPLGWTHVSGTEVLPFTDVNCGRVRQLLRQELRWDSRVDRERKLGRALGRVLAHELYHVFARTKKHGSAGLAKASYSAADLTAAEFRFDEDDLGVLRARRAELQGEVADAEDDQ